jgi:hypothetical protein
VNDDLHVDLENLQMLQCIICISEKMANYVLSQSFVLRKGLIKYNKINGIIPMKTHVDSIHPWLFAQRKSQLAKKATMSSDASHVSQQGEKKTRPFSCIITIYFGSTNPFRKKMRYNKCLLKILCFTFVKFIDQFPLLLLLML